MQATFSAIPTKSIDWKTNLHKMCKVSLFWTIGRMLKGILDLAGQSSIINIVNTISDPKKNSVSLLKSAVCIAVIIVTELICLFLVLDYGLLKVFFEKETEEALTPRMNKFRRSLIGLNPHVEEKNIVVIEQLKDTKKEPLGKIFKAEFNSEVVFYRIMNFSRLSSYIKEEISKEIDSYKDLSVVGIIPVLEIIFQPDTVGLIYPFYSNGSLYELLHNSATKLNYYQKTAIMYSIAETLKQIHSAKRFHGHLTSLNILLDENMQPFISDLGFHNMKKYAGVMYGYSYKSA